MAHGDLSRPYATRGSVNEPVTAPNAQADLKPTQTDGLWPMARWERDRALPVTLDMLATRVADGETLRDVCRSLGWPASMVAKWIAEDANRKERYEFALRLWADQMAQESVGIADGGSDEVARDKLRVDTRLRIAAKWDRERYGEAKDVAVGPAIQINIGIEPDAPAPVIEHTPTAPNAVEI